MAAAGADGRARRRDPPPPPSQRVRAPLPRRPRLQAVAPRPLRPHLPPPVPRLPRSPSPPRPPPQAHGHPGRPRAPPHPDRGPYPDRGRSRALDCRHGRVLLHVGTDCWHFVVWDPVTGDQHRLEEPGIPWLIYSAALLCAVPSCDHLNCHGGPFRVVFVVTDDYEELVKATVYSSETGAWSTPVTLDSGCESYAQHRRDALADGRFYYTPYVQPRRGAVIGDEAYFTLRWGNAIVKYGWGNNSVSLINPPTQNVYHVALMVMEDSSLGFAYVRGSSLYLWSRKVNSEAAAEWIQCRAIELEKTIPVTNPDDKPFVVGCAEGMGAIFVSTGAGLFTIRLPSGLVKKVDESGVYFSVLPYMSFYTPDRGRLLSLARTR